MQHDFNAVRTAVRLRYGEPGELEVDDDARVVPVPDAYWVTAKIRISHDDVEFCTGEGSAGAP